MTTYRLEWQDAKGGFHSENSRYIGRFWHKLKTIRCDATLWTVDDMGVKINIIGGCEPAEGHDDKRIKWNWWYDSTYGTEVAA